MWYLDDLLMFTSALIILVLYWLAIKRANGEEMIDKDFWKRGTLSEQFANK